MVYLNFILVKTYEDEIICKLKAFLEKVTILIFSNSKKETYSSLARSYFTPIYSFRNEYFPIFCISYNVYLTISSPVKYNSFSIDCF